MANKGPINKVTFELKFEGTNHLKSWGNGIWVEGRTSTRMLRQMRVWRVGGLTKMSVWPKRVREEQKKTSDKELGERNAVRRDPAALIRTLTLMLRRWGQILAEEEPDVILCFKVTLAAVCGG